jgi:hypothetical protein
MPVPDFSPGEVLTAAAMDSIGLWLVKSQTVGTGVPSVVVTGAFSSDYDNYLVTISGIATAAPANISILLGTSGGNNFYGSFYFDAYTGSNTGTSRANNGASLQIGHGEAFLSESWMRLEIAAPNLPRSTSFTGQHYGTSFSGWMAGTRADSVQYTSFTISSTSDMTGGTIRVYGYRN